MQPYGPTIRVCASPRIRSFPAPHSTAMGTRELSRTPRRFSGPDSEPPFALEFRKAREGTIRSLVGNVGMEPRRTIGADSESLDEVCPMPETNARAMDGMGQWYA